MMKRIFFIVSLFLILTVPLFAKAKDKNPPESDENGDEKEEVQDFSYTINGKGDQFIKIALMPNFPLNFGGIPDGQMYVGGAAQLGYFRFLNSWLALGGELMVGYNPTIGSNSFVYVPITFGVLFQPRVWKFEFPIIQSIGMAFETCANKKYFPGFVTKTEAGAYFRMNDSWSFGLGCEFLYLPEWNPSTKGADNDYGLFMTIVVGARYHF